MCEYNDIPWRLWRLRSQGRWVDTSRLEIDLTRHILTSEGD